MASAAVLYESDFDPWTDDWGMKSAGLTATQLGSGLGTTFMLESGSVGSVQSDNIDRSGYDLDDLLFEVNLVNTVGISRIWLQFVDIGGAGFLGSKTLAVTATAQFYSVLGSSITDLGGNTIRIKLERDTVGSVGTYNFARVSEIPEPSTGLLVALGLSSLGAKRRLQRA